MVQECFDYAAANGGKPWRYVLIPHIAIAVNMMLGRLAGSLDAIRTCEVDDAVCITAIA
ncbi:hypothetical protein NTGHW29_150008 [Candidatus Nitrotoga sp. HW29]|uniref:hypothetical protein n=1 Tax=Candidatus Nitrotoga sp. HW29 TaxID=2886963 RepID=UPI001EF3B3E8|nr:hypothetical protein [Candidatus Nitrotoga sp. HW29]CAH1903764.1 hypothetical protein NTGHW29_150008 [Candidatus Nitrotoga sp. HW29]